MRRCLAALILLTALAVTAALCSIAFGTRVVGIGEIVRGPRSRPMTSSSAPHTAIAAASTGTWFQRTESSEPLSQRIASMALYTLP